MSRIKNILGILIKTKQFLECQKKLRISQHKPDSTISILFRFQLVNESGSDAAKFLFWAEKSSMSGKCWASSSVQAVVRLDSSKCPKISKDYENCLIMMKIQFEYQAKLMVFDTNQMK